MYLFTLQYIYIYIYLYTLILIYLLCLSLPTLSLLKLLSSTGSLFPVPCSLLAAFIFINMIPVSVYPCFIHSCYLRSIYTSIGTFSNTFSFRMPVLTSSCPCPLARGEQSSHLRGFLAYQN